MPNAGGGFLHIPNKGWVGMDPPNVPGPTSTTTPVTTPSSTKWSSTHEKQNYDRLEQWARRLPRGIVGGGVTTTPLNVSNGDTTFHVFVETGAVQMDLGRLYQVTAHWADITSTQNNAFDGVGIQIQFVPVTSGRLTGSGPIMYSYVLGGGQIVQLATPNINTTGLFNVRMMVKWWDGPSPTVTVIGEPIEQGWIYVQDMGVNTLGMAAI